MHQRVKIIQIAVFLGSLESTERGDSNRTSRRANRDEEGTQTRCQGNKCAKIGTTQSGMHVGIWGYNGRWGRKASDEMCTEKVKGTGWERQTQRRLQKCRIWPDMYLMDGTGAVTVRAALKLAVQLVRGDKVNRQADMANLTTQSKCRDVARDSPLRRPEKSPGSRCIMTAPPRTRDAYQTSVAQMRLQTYRAYLARLLAHGKWNRRFTRLWGLDSDLLRMCDTTA
jgi:hypothetical protein